MLFNPRLYLLALVLSAALGQDCNNPLFSADNWPEDEIDRPSYLTEPIDASTVDLGLCSGLIGGCSKTCCDAGTIEDIDNLVRKYLEHLAKKGEHFVGPILDTIGDFDPNTQEMVGMEYDTDGNHVGDIIGDLTIDSEQEDTEDTNNLGDTDTTEDAGDTDTTEEAGDTDSTDNTDSTDSTDNTATKRWCAT